MVTSLSVNKNNMKRISFFIYILLATSLIACRQEKAPTESPAQVIAKVRDIWTKDQAVEWYGKQGWLRGSDFIPSTAINQLEMWQAETFDTATINRELGWAE